MLRVASVSGDQATALRNAAEILCALSPLPPLDSHRQPGAKVYVGRHSTVIGIPFSEVQEVSHGVYFRLVLSRTRSGARRVQYRSQLTVFHPDHSQVLWRQRKQSKVTPGSSPTSPHMLEQVMNERKLSSSKAHGGVGSVPPCNHCGEMESPQWRKGPSAYSLPPPFRRVRIPSAHLWSSGVVTSLLYTMGLVNWLIPGDKPHLCNACGTRYLRKGSLNHSANRRSGPAHLKGRTAPAAAALAV